MAPDTTVVIPCYNEAGRLDAQAFESFASTAVHVRLLLVDDGSTDDTRQLLTRLASAHPHVISILSLPHNGGKAEAVRRGTLLALTHAPTFVGYWDADLSTPLDQIAVFRDHLMTHESWGVIGSRVRLLGSHIERLPIRHYMGRVFASLASLALGFAVYDTQCGAKLFRAVEVREVFEKPFIGRWSFDVELLARIAARCRDTGQGNPEDVLVEHPLPIWRDLPGSKLGARQMLVATMDLGRVWRRYR